VLTVVRVRMFAFAATTAFAPMRATPAMMTVRNGVSRHGDSF
jgi:hypothetical protein